ncbi:MAG: aminotransferase class I/II-fold pyridoxal phosphate-dependent enzyme [Candidatus Eisenbacteria bacterium]|uniref:Aminotransferase class I/II-fold pyridoxal phosphate-dependent enzyme n=1 Tax=Eiseniibacteriota bacterium TaxID=2212470 RepID=A0A956LYP7_UNCEI|nr:aminotransferase class I/II-fold pyridoxal phosphate-dependent enzyme [Candidatus Eisenbacteria bacterium]
MSKRIYLSPPHMSGLEQEFVSQAFETNWVAPLGPHVDAFEADFASYVGTKHAAALSSGTAGLHLALILAGVEPGDEVIVSSLTFVASVNPIRYVGATPVLIDSERDSWNIDPSLAAEAIQDRIRKNGRPPKAFVLVHLYGQSADVAPIQKLCEEHGIILLEDAAEALGSTYHEKAPGTFGKLGIFSFNGNKIITTSGGGMLVSDDGDLIAHARKLSTQARDTAPHYQHTEVGFNYRMSNICAGIGRGQLAVLPERIQARRANFSFYRTQLREIPGIDFQPEASWGRHTRWLSCILLSDAFGATREDLRVAFEKENIEARPLWKPMHLQPLYEECAMYGGAVADDLFARGLCLPSGSSLSDEDRERIVGIVRNVAGTGR